jgi:Mg-chelatase subunit ChlD
MKRMASRLRTFGTTAAFGLSPILLVAAVGGLAGCSRSKAAPPFSEQASAPVGAPAVATATASAGSDETAAPAASAAPAPPASPAPAEKAAAARRPAATASPTMPGRAGPAARHGDPLADATGFGVSPQFNGVKAGEWDDNASFREFQRFLASSPVGQRRMNLADRRFLVVRDKNGLGIPRCRVTVRDGKQTSATFVTTASGRAILFPHAEGMSGDKLSATAACGEGTTEATFPLLDQEDGLVDLKLQKERTPIATRAVDLAFVLDTTGSMSEEIAAVKATIQKVAKSLSTEQTVIRIGLVEYKDRQDPFVTKVYPFATDLVGFAQQVNQINAGGGGDTPEDMNAGLHAAMTKLDWSDRSVARMAFVIADAPPHLDYQDGPEYTTDMKTASHRGIQLFTVAASGMDGLGQVVFRQMAQYTGATNMFVLRGGAGPQSTGGGDPVSSCGGTHTNYSSGKLDELIVQKIRRELRSVDADPLRIAGLRTDENAKPCDQRIVFKD